LNLPTDLAELATGAGNFTQDDVVLTTANDIKDQYVGGNLTALETLDVLEFLVTSVYKSSANQVGDMYACEFNGLAGLDCDGKDKATKSPRSDGAPIRSATLAGMFVDAPWATGGTPLTLDEMSDWYSTKDFDAMKALGLNTVQIFLPTAAFTVGDKFGAKIKALFETLLGDIETAGLDVVVSLVGTGDELDAVVAAAKYASTQSAILALTLPSNTKLDSIAMVEAIRAVATKLSLFLPMRLGDLIKMSAEFDDNVYGSLEMPHTGTVADIASSTSQEDRSKLFYHEATSCMARSPLEFGACFQSMPIFVGSGFDLSIDDCVNKDIVSSFKDYGQCDRFDESINSGWWARHRASFAGRQVYAYERGLGWSFAAWKLYGEHHVGMIDTPAKLLSLKDVAEAGLFPSLDESIPAQEACLNPPDIDFALGDATLAPTAGPPPDCGNGWWNATTTKCDYWIPPPEPTPSPTAACPVCEDCGSTTVMAAEHPYASGAMGVVLGAVLGAIVMKVCFSSNRRNEYDPIPN
jgi:hypothetical protein